MKTFNFVLFLFIVFGSSVSNAQYRVAGDGDLPSSYTTEQVDSQRGLAADLSAVGQLKIFVRKAEYNFDEILLLDIALLVRQKDELYVPVNMDATIHARGKSGAEITVKGFYSAYLVPAFLRSRDALIFSSYKLVVGCPSSETAELNSEDNQIMFEKNKFQTILEGCIDLNNSGQIELWAELSNRHVAIPKTGETPKTAVGKIRSNSLIVTIK